MRIYQISFINSYSYIVCPDHIVPEKFLTFVHAKKKYHNYFFSF
jgi:hypothetical protein